ncbi:MAG: extracellular solute-binding protein [Chloroflexota bacterium]|nr:extracellular solute-binding protein [Chloroflexota bacterium]
MGSAFRSASFAMVIAIVLASCGGSTPAASTAPSATSAATTAASAAPAASGKYDEAAAEKQLYDAAVNAGEKEVNLYSSINEQEAGPLLEIWAKEFPKIKANFIRASETALVSRVLTEAQGHKPNFDVLETTTSQLIADAGLALKYFPPSAGLIPAELKDPKGYWFSIYTNWCVVEFNTTKMKKTDITSYQDFLKPQFKGQIVLDSTEYDWYAGMIHEYGQDKADALIKQIRDTNGITLINGHGTMNDDISSGQFAVTLTQYVNQAERSKRQKAPVDWLAIQPVTVITSGKVIVDKDAPHPNAAKLMADFLASTSAQKYLASRGRQITRSDVPQEPPGLLDGLKTWTAPVLTPSENQALAKKFKALFQ